MTRKQKDFMRKVIRLGFDAGVKWGESAEKESPYLVMSNIEVEGEQLFKKLHLTAIDTKLQPKCPKWDNGVCLDSGKGCDGCE